MAIGDMWPRVAQVTVYQIFAVRLQIEGDFIVWYLPYYTIVAAVSISDRQDRVKGLVVISKHSIVYVHFSTQFIPIVQRDFPLQDSNK